MGKLFFALLLLGISGAYSESTAQPCIGIGCKSDNSCGQTQSSSNRNCCCNPVCGVGGCVSCLQNCWLACTISCTTITCPNCTPAGGGGLANSNVFKVRPANIDAAWKEHIVAGIVLKGRSNDGTTPLFSELIRGGTSLYGYQVGFSVNITAGPQHVLLDILFDPERTSGGPVPANVRFELDGPTGEMRLVGIPAEALEAIQREIAFRNVPCTTVLSMAAAAAHP